MNIILATGNHNKVKEIYTLSAESTLKCQVYAYTDFIQPIEVDENGTSFEQNACIKLEAISSALIKEAKSQNQLADIFSQPCVIMAEDSGLCVEALRNEPSIYSARYVQYKYANNPKYCLDSKNLENLALQGTDSHNIAVLITELHKANITRSKAYFIASIAMLCINHNDMQDSQKHIKCFEGRLYGEVIDTPLGELGFGYDPVFIPQSQAYETESTSKYLGATLAQIPLEYKNRISHRAKAIRLAFSYLSTLVIDKK